MCISMTSTRDNGVVKVLRSNLSRSATALLLNFFVTFVLSFCPFDISVGVGAFVIGLSQISSFFSHNVFVRNILERVTRFKTKTL